MKVLAAVVVLLLATSVLSSKASAQYHWRRTLAGSFQGIAFNPLSAGEIIYTASYDSIGIYRSDDHGLTWARYFDGLEPFSTSNIRQILCVPTDTNVVLAVSPSKLYRSVDGGRTWSELPNLGGIEGEAIDYQEATDVLYYGQNFKGPTWKSTDHGANWTVSGAANAAVGLCTIAASPDLPVVLLAGSQGGEIARSTEEGENWTIQLGKDPGSPFDPEVPKIVYSKQATNASGVRGIALSTRWPSLGNAIVKTEDNGLSWHSLNHASKNPWALEIDQRAGMIASPADAAYPGPLHFWTGLFHDRSDTCTNGLIQETTDGGITWHSTGFPAGVLGDTANPATRDIWVMKFDTTSGRLIASSSTGIWIAETRSGVSQSRQSGRSPVVIREGHNFVVVGATSLTLYDMLGRTVCGAGGSTLPFERVSRGCYTLAIAKDHQVSYYRVIL